MCLGNRIETCTDPGCVDSYIDEFTSTGFDTSSLDLTSVASEINSLQSGLTSFGVTLTSTLSIPSSVIPSENSRPTVTYSSYSGPYVSDIVSSYSEYTETRTAIGSSGGSGGFTFNTETFQATKSDSTSTSVITTTPPYSTGMYFTLRALFRAGGNKLLLQL